MDFENFVSEMVEAVSRRLGGRRLVTAEKMRKNNGVVLTALVIRDPASNVAPCLYLDNAFGRVKEGKLGIEEAADEIMALYEKSGAEDSCDIDTSELQTYETVRRKVRTRLVSTERNTELLKEVPHRDFLDLSVVYCAVWECGSQNCEGDFLIHNRNLDMWGITEQELYIDACINMRESNENILMSITDVLPSLPEKCMKKMAMYILTNFHYTYGASAVLDANMLRKASSLFHGDFMLIPSSVHEFMLFSAKDFSGKDDVLKEMLKSANNTVVRPEELLGYHVYRYHAGNGSVTVAA